MGFFLIIATAGQMSQKFPVMACIFTYMYRHISKTLLVVLFFSSRYAQCQTEDPASWPKIQLHLHLDCSLSYDVVKTLDPSISPEDYRRDFIAPARCTDLRDYIARAARSIELM